MSRSCHVPNRCFGVTQSAAAVRCQSAIRLLILCGALVLALGALAGVLRQPLLAAAIGPTLYVLLVHPDTEVAQIRNAIVGHTAAIGAGLASLALLGLWRTPPVLGSGGVPFRRAAAVALSIALTVAALELCGTHHAPAAATSLLVGVGISRPGPGLIGLIVGLVAVIAVTPVVAQLPARQATLTDHQPPPMVDERGSG